MTRDAKPCPPRLRDKCYQGLHHLLLSTLTKHCTDSSFPSIFTRSALIDLEECVQPVERVHGLAWISRCPRIRPSKHPPRCASAIEEAQNMASRWVEALVYYNSGKATTTTLLLMSHRFAAVY